MRFSTVLIVGVAVASAGVGVYKLGHAVDAPANEIFTVAAAPKGAAVATAESNLATAVSAASTYKLDHTGYGGMSAGDLREYDAALSREVSVKSASSDAYCMESTVAGSTVSVRGPNGSFALRPCAAPS